MNINKIAVGNAIESFIEGSFTPDFNIISSDDNNKGKTIIIQSAMYALGNEPAFPSSFDYKKYYHVVEFEENGIIYTLCRYNQGFILKYLNVLMIFDSVSELKRYWTKNIFELPQIFKNGILRIVDPVLFLQLFFIGQDKKDSHNIANPGFYNKTDFYNMIFVFNGLVSSGFNPEEIEIAKSKISNLKDERSLLLKQHKILKSKKTAVEYLSSVSDREVFDRKIKLLDKINNKIAELRKARNIASTRKAKWETTIKELRSLNRTIESGELRCMDCNSSNISLSKKNSYSFDVSTIEIRSDIIASIQDKIAAYNEEIEKYAADISKEQDALRELMSDDIVSLEALLEFKHDMFNASDAEIRIKEIDIELEGLLDKLHISDNTDKIQKEKQEILIQDTVRLMNETYSKIDPTGNLYFDDLFSKRDELFSGSEATMFHLVKLYSLAVILRHKYPIIIDSFRAEDLSSQKEDVVLDIYSKLESQKIFTTTLKAEELGKYEKYKNINHIDFKDNKPSKILSEKDNIEFAKILKRLSIDISK